LIDSKIGLVIGTVYIEKRNLETISQTKASLNFNMLCNISKTHIHAFKLMGKGGNT
jgi:hypothetical protein